MHLQPFLCSVSGTLPYSTLSCHHCVKKAGSAPQEAWLRQNYCSQPCCTCQICHLTFKKNVDLIFLCHYLKHRYYFFFRWRPAGSFKSECMISSTLPLPTHPCQTFKLGSDCLSHVIFLQWPHHLKRKKKIDHLYFPMIVCETSFIHAEDGHAYILYRSWGLGCWWGHCGVVICMGWPVNW